jgi:hypothetical protein
LYSQQLQLLPQTHQEMSPDLYMSLQELHHMEAQMLLMEMKVKPKQKEYFS